MFPFVKRRLLIEELEDRRTPATLLALDATGTSLLRLDSATPGTITTTTPITGLAVGGATESLVSLDFRPASGQLFALGVNETPVGDDEGRLYLLDPVTAVATLVGAGPFSTTMTDAATSYGFDFNPVADAIRIVNDAEQNLRVNPNTGALIQTDTNLAFSADPDLTGTPDVVAAAYTNNVPNAATTTLFDIDSTLDRLLTQVPPNEGTLNDVGPLGFDTTAEVGFDIGSDGAAFASMTGALSTNSQLFTINTTTGAATLVGAIGSLPGTVRDIAVAPPATLSFAATTVNGTEGGTAVVTVTRFGDTSGTSSVDVVATGGSASAGSDFTGLPVTITFAPGETTKTVTVTLSEDTTIEGSETVTLGFANVTGGVAGKLNVATINLADNDFPDTTAPTVTINQAAGQTDPAFGSPVTFTVVFSEPVTGFTSTDVPLSGTAASGATTVVSGSGATYTVTVTVTNSGTLTAAIPAGAANDSAGNASLASTSTDNTVTVNLGADTTAPTVTINQAAGQADPTNQSPVLFTVVFSESVTGFAADDVTLSGGGATGATATVTGSGTTYTVSVAGFTRAGPVRADVRAGATSDAAGNASLASTSTDNQVVFNFGKGLGPNNVLAVGAGTGAEANVRVYNANADELFRFTAFPGYNGGVRVATGDFNNDGVVDVAFGNGPGAAALVKVIDGKTKTQLFEVAPFELSYLGGVYVAAGDVTGDGVADLIITADQTGGARVRIFNGVDFKQVNDFFGIEDANFRGGARAAVGDVNGDGIGDLIVTAGFGGGPRIAVFNGATIATPVTSAQLPPKLVGDFFVFEPTLRNGVYIAAGDITGDGFADVLAGGGPGGGPRVFGVSGADLITSKGTRFTQVANFFSGDSDNRQGVRLAVKNLDDDTRADLVVGAGEDEGLTVIGYRGADIPADGTPTRDFDFDPFDARGGLLLVSVCVPTTCFVNQFQ